MGVCPGTGSNDKCDCMDSDNQNQSAQQRALEEAKRGHNWPIGPGLREAMDRIMQDTRWLISINTYPAHGPDVWDRGVRALHPLNGRGHHAAPHETDSNESEQGIDTGESGGASPYGHKDLDE